MTDFLQQNHSLGQRRFDLIPLDNGGLIVVWAQEAHVYQKLVIPDE